MSPAFSSPRQAAAYVGLLAFLLLLPVIMRVTGLASRPDAYAAMPFSTGWSFPFIREQIFQETSDLDVVCLGSSRVYTGFDARYLRRELSAQLGRDAKVVVLASSKNGEDRTYLLLRDLLQHRRVRMMVFVISSEDFEPVYNEPFVWGYRFFPRSQIRT